MDGYTLKQNNQKSWAIVYAVIRKGVFTLSEDKDNFQQGEHLRVSLLSSPAIYVGKVTGDNKRYSSIYFIKMTFSNESSTPLTNNSLALNSWAGATDKACTVTLGFRIEETRNTWFYAIMTEHAKLFINRQPNIEHSSCVSSSPSSVSSLHSSFKQRASLRKRRSVPTDEQQQQQQRRRSLSLNFENMIRQRPLSRVFSSIFATNSNNNNNNNIKNNDNNNGTNGNKTPITGKGRRDSNNNPFGFFTP